MAPDYKVSGRGGAQEGWRMNRTLFAVLFVDALLIIALGAIIAVHVQSRPQWEQCTFPYHPVCYGGQGNAEPNGYEVSQAWSPQPNCIVMIGQYANGTYFISVNQNQNVIARMGNATQALQLALSLLCYGGTGNR